MRQLMTQTITIIGAGAAGFSAALELAEKGYKVRLIERKTLGSGASGRNPGRMGHGFHYSDVETAKAYLRATIKVQRKYPDFLLAGNIPNSPLRHGRYFITKDSNPGKEEILEGYEQIKAEYARLIAEDPANEVFGPPDQFYRILDPSEYLNDVNMDIVDIGIETNEHLFRWQDFSNYMRHCIEQHPNIELMENTTVVNLARNTEGKERFSLEIQSDQQPPQTISTDYLVNSTWENIERLNAQLGIKMEPDQRTNRLKTLLIVDLPPELQSKNSMFFCMGQHCMMSNMGDGRAMMTYAKVTNIETCSDLALSENAERLLQEGPTQEEVEFYGRQIIEGVSRYIPAMKEAKIKDLKFGIVQTLGKLSLEQLRDPSHPFNKRSDHNIRAEQIGLVSNPCMKLFYFADNGEIVSELVANHIQATEIIDQVIALYQQRATAENLKFTPKIERRLREQFERGTPEQISEKSVTEMVENLLSLARTNQSLKGINLFSGRAQATKPINITSQPSSHH